MFKEDQQCMMDCAALTCLRSVSHDLCLSDMLLIYRTVFGRILSTHTSSAVINCYQKHCSINFSLCILMNLLFFKKKDV